MKQLVKKIALLLLLVLFANGIINYLFIQPNTTYSWGYDRIHAKRQFLKENNANINSLFLGSSAMYRHIDPALFDAHVDSSVATRSFNFGIEAMFPSQAIYLYKNLLAQDSVDLDYVFMDMFEIGNFFLIANVHRKRTHYWYHWEQYKDCVSTVMGYESPFLVKTVGFMSFSLGYAYKLMNVGVVEELLLFKKNEKEQVFDYSALGRAKNGYYALDQEQADRKGKTKEFDFRHNWLTHDTLQLQKPINNNMAFYKNYQVTENQAFNEQHWQLIQELIALSEAKGIQLVFILSPRLAEYQFPILLPLFDKIDSKHKMDMSKYSEFPEFYEAAYTFDALHLNHKGAQLFSKELAKKFNTLAIGKSETDKESVRQ